MTATITARRTALVAFLALACGAGLAPGARGAIAPRIVGGPAVAASEYPWQVAIVDHDSGDQFCGGVIRDALHVITAAHCLDYRPPDGVDDATTRDVVAGANDLSPLTPGAQRVQVASWTRMPEFDDQALTDDAALVTLSAALDVTAAAVRPAVLTAAGDLTAPGVAARVSGFGATPADTTILHEADVLTVSDPACDAFTALGGIDAATQLCAIAPGRDSCFGDCGGPLTLDDGTLIGLVSWGPQTCADPSGAPGVYTELAQSAIADFVRAGGYAPPASSAAPTLTGVAKSGDPLTCSPGTWDGSPLPELDYRFRDAAGATLRGWAADPVYVPAAADAGRRARCVVRARDARGASVAVSALSDPIAGPPAPVADPLPGAAPLGAVPATPPAANPPAGRPDTTAPRGALRSIRCRRGTCTLRIRASDDASGSGVRRVRVTLLPRRGASRTVTARPLGHHVYTVTFRHVSRGTAWFLVTVQDRAGNRQARPAARHAAIR